MTICSSHARPSARATPTTSSVETTFDFLNTHDNEDGFPVEQLPTLDVRPELVRRSRRDPPRRRRSRRDARRRRDRERAARDLERVHAVRAALREVADAVVEHRAPRQAALDTVNRALHARQVIELVPAPDGVSVDHRHVGDPVDDALARLSDPLVIGADRRPPGADQDLRQRHLPLDLLRHLTHRPAPLVRHGHLRQPGEGRAPPGAREDRSAEADPAI